MISIINTYIHFKDNAREAMEFYKSVFGGELTLSTFGEYQTSEDSSENNKIMHSMLTCANGSIFMASDTPKSINYTKSSGFSLSISGDNEEELRGYWDKLKNGGTIVMPLEKSQWGDTFGMLVDKFGIAWMINISVAGK